MKVSTFQCVKCCEVPFEYFQDLFDLSNKQTSKFDFLGKIRSSDEENVCSGEGGATCNYILQSTSTNEKGCKCRGELIVYGNVS